MENNPFAAIEKQAFLQKILLDHPGGSSAQQRTRLLTGLLKYPLTTHELRQLLGIYYAPARVFELRALGHNIATAWQRVTVGQTSHRIGLYALQTAVGAQS